MATVDDGTGSGFKAKVTKLNLLGVAGVVSTRFQQFVERGEGFIVSSGALPIAALGVEGILFMQNTGEGSFFIESIGVHGDVALRWEVFRNPTTGTLISAGVAVVPGNLNFNSNNALTGVFKKGTDGSTITNGTIISTIEAEPGVHEYLPQGALILEEGNSIAIQSTVGAAANLAVNIQGHFEVK